jgi:hypothetical protein
MQLTPHTDTRLPVEPPLRPADITQKATDSDHSSAVSLEWLLDQLDREEDMEEDQP